MKHDKKGFTIIELLVVIAVIGILAVVVVGAVGSARSKGRDSVRKNELHQLETALELYYNLHATYPVTGATGPTDGAISSATSEWSSTLSTIISTDTITVLPVDPTNIDKGTKCWDGAGTKNTVLTYQSDGTHYVLCTWMENAGDIGTLAHRDVVNPWAPNTSLHADFGYADTAFAIAK
jgi:prepilin-type N-terminal cleavage/methylation domain-containing protein